MTDFEEDDWVDLEKTASTARSKAMASVSISATGRGSAHSPTFRSILFFRREAADWIAKNGPRFRVQVGGADCNKIRIVPDAGGGRFENVVFHGVQRLILGIVNLWPAEPRKGVEAAVEFADNHLILTLPRDFAKATAPAPTPVTQEPPKAQARPEPFPVTTRAAGLEAMAEAAKRRTVVPMAGKPMPGRSALDKKSGR